MNGRRLLAVPWVALLTAVALAGCTTTPPTAPTASGLPILSDAADFDGATGWIGTEPLSLDDLSGQVVLVDFWTYSCVNCIRTLPHVTGWYSNYRDHGLVVLGVHSPEFDFEKERQNVIESMDRFGIEYPVAQDNDFGVWRDYSNHYWPAKYLIDGDGRIRYTHFGEGDYAETEEAIRALLREEGHDDLPPVFEGEEAAANRGSGITRELYAGTWRQPDAVGNPEGSPAGRSVDYTLPPASERQKDSIYLDGTWHNDREYLQAEGPGAVVLRFRAGAANFVADGPMGPCVPVSLDGQPMRPSAAGPSVSFDDPAAPCILLAATPRSYDFFSDPVGTHEVRFDVPTGFRLYTFAFSAYDEGGDA